MRTVGLYEEGIKKPRIEYRVMIGDEDITDRVNGLWSENLMEFLAEFEEHKTDGTPCHCDPEVEDYRKCSGKK